MAKMKMGDVTYEGTAEELAELMARMNIIGNTMVAAEDGPAVETETEPSPRLKVGDYITVIDAKTKGGASRYGVVYGEIRVVKVDDGTRVPFRCATLDGSDSAYFREEAVVLATESEVAAAKQALERKKDIGEFVDGGYAVVVDASKSACMSNAPNGTFVKVETTTPLPYSLYLTLHTNSLYSGNYGGYCNADALRKITKEEYEEATNHTPSAPRLKVGDYARTLIDKDVPLGAIVKIERDDSSEVPYKAYLLDGSDYNWYLDSELEKVGAGDVLEKAKWAAIGRNVGEYKGGDILRGKRTNGDTEYIYGRLKRSDMDVKGNYAVYDGEQKFRSIDGKTIELIAPVESLFTTVGDPQ